jgi:hypothetical protein
MLQSSVRKFIIHNLSLIILLVFPMKLHKNVNGFYGDDKFWIINGVMDEFSFTMRMHKTRSTQNFEMLRSNRLLKLQRVVDFVHINRFVLVDELKDFHPQRVCQGPQDVRGDLKLVIIDLENTSSHRVEFFVID